MLQDYNKELGSWFKKTEEVAASQQSETKVDLAEERRWSTTFGSVSPRLDGGKIPGRPRYREVECRDEVGRTVYWSAVLFDNIYGFSKGSHIVKLRQCQNCNFLGRILYI